MFRPQLFWLVCSLSCACTTITPRTQIMLEIDADTQTRDRLHTLHVLVYGSDDQGKHWQQQIDEQFTQDAAGGPWSLFDWPARVAIVPKQGRVGRILDVQAQALDADGKILVWQSAAAGFSEGHTTLLRLELTADCLSDALACGDQGCVGSGADCQTCRAGTCVDVGFTDKLPQYTPADRDAASSLGHDAAMNDAAADKPVRTDSGSASDAAAGDAGMDAAGSDGGDAAAAEAGNDATQPEAGSGDAANSDTGVADTGTPDTGVNDAAGDAVVAPLFEAMSSPATISSVTGAVSVDFSAPVQASSVTVSSFLVQRDGQPVLGTLMTSGNSVSFTPTLPWPLGATISIDLGADLHDNAGHALTPKIITVSVREGQWAAATSAGDSAGGAPALAMSDDGQATLVWPRSMGTYPQVWASRYKPEPPAWSALAQISTGTASAPANSPVVAMNAAGHAVAVWQFYDGVHTSGCVDGSTWSTPQRTLDGSAYGPAVVFGTSGDQAFAAMQLNHATLSVAAISFTAGASGGSTLTDIGGSMLSVTDSAPQLALLGSGQIVVWKRVASGQTRIYASPITLSQNTALSAMNAPASNPVLDADPKRNSAFALWAQTDATWTNIWAARIVSGGNWSAALRVSNDVSSTSDPSIGVDDKGRAIAVWQQAGAVMSAHFTPGQGWSASEPISAPGIVSAALPSVAVEPGGNAIAVWTQDGSSAKEVWAARYVFDGSGWVAAERKRVSAADAAASGRAQVAVDASGRAFAAWYQASATWVARFQ